MLGDWVNDRSRTKYCRVTAIGNDGYVTIKRQSDGWEYQTHHNNILPVHISPEILEKNGFVKSRIFEEWKYEDGDVYMLWKPFPFLEVRNGGDSRILSPCEYVHELQHAIRLAGINKKIVL